MRKLYTSLMAIAAGIFAANAAPSEIINLPAGLQAEEWVLSHQDEARLVNVAIDGTDIYLGNLTDCLPDSYVKGHINADTVTFPFTYLGYCDVEGVEQDLFFLPVTWDVRNIEIAGGWWEDYYVTDEFTFAYDAEQHVLSTIEDYASILIGFTAEVGDLGPGWIEYYYEPEIRQLDPANASAPLGDPIFIGALYDDYFENYSVEFYLPGVNSAGYPIVTANAWYVFYVNGQPFTFDTSTYWGLEEEMTEIPYTFTDDWNWDIYSQGEYHAVAFYQVDDIDTVGLKMYYRLADGTVLESAYVEKSLWWLSKHQFGGVANVSVDAVATRYYDLQGRPIADPDRGLYIRVTTDPTGATTATKVCL